MKNFLLLLMSFLMVGIYVQAQNPDNPQEFLNKKDVPIIDPVCGKGDWISIKYPCGEIAVAVAVPMSDKDNTASNGKPQANPYWEADLGRSYTLSILELSYDEIIHVNGLSNYYILTSDHAFDSEHLGEQLSKDCVQYVKVEKGLPNGSEIFLGGLKGRYLRIQSADAEEGVLALKEIGPGGDVEECGNGKDDDCDGLVDCEDPDCGINIVNVYQQDPSCTICNDGFISIQAGSGSGGTILYSVNGGAPFNCGGVVCPFPNLGEGTYTFLLTDGGECDKEVVVTLAAPVVSNESDCANGGFEDGNFNNWTTQDGQIEDDGDLDGSWINITSNFVANSFEIFQSGNVDDDNFPSGPTVYSPTNGTNIVKLGDLGGGNDTRRMINCFTVDAANADFAFNYGLVLQDPDHDEDEQPYFEWKVYVSGNSANPIDGDKVTAGTSFFENSNGLSVKGWECENVNLSAFIGQTVCAEFRVTDCTEGGHGAYAYIDAICQPAAPPSCDFALPTMSICKNQDIEIDFSELTNNFNQYSLAICQGDNTNCPNIMMTQGYNIEQVDLNTLASNLGISLVCGETYTVELNLASNCGNCVQRETFTYYCLDMELNYPDIVVCGDPNSITIPGTTNCPGCTYEWTPGVNMNNNNLQNPTLDGTTNLNTFNQPYTITATNSVGCIETATVNFLPDFNVNIDKHMDHCKVNITATISADFPIIASGFDFHVTDSYNNNDFVLTGTNLDPFTVEITGSISRDQPSNLQLSSYFTYSTPGIVSVGTCVNNIGFFEHSLFDRKWRMYMPNAFSPNGNGINDIYHPFIRTPLDADMCDSWTSNSSVYYLKMQVFDGWGGLMWESEASVPVTSYGGLDGSEVAWDGTVNGELVNPDVYVWQLTILSCTNEYGACSDDATPCSSSQGEHCSLANSPEERIIAGDVTVVL